MSGLPGGHPGSTTANWVVNPWDSQWLDILEHQWNDVAIPFWADIQARAADADVQVCIEMHPHNLVFNPPTLQRLVEQTRATHVGAEMDPSHLFWQGIDPVAAVEHLGDLVFHAAAKDTRINPGKRPRVRRPGRPLHPYADRPQPAEPRRPQHSEPMAHRPVLAVRSRRPRPRRSEFWVPVPAGAARVDPDMAVNIEHEDTELDQIEGLRQAAENLLAAPQAPASDRAPAATPVP
jgi:sugar phosphate isomerase/epimerase